MELIKNRITQRYHVLAVIVLAYTAAVLLFTLSSPPSGSFPSFFIETFYIVIVLSFLLSAFIILAKNPLTLELLILGKLVLLLIMGYPFQKDLGFELVLFAGILYEAGMVLDSPRNIALSAFIVITGTYFQQPNPLFGSNLLMAEIHPLPAETVILFSSITSLIAFLTCGRARDRERTRVLDQKLNELEMSVDTLMKANLSFQQYADKADEIATQKERERITREIHDSSGYIYTNLIALMEVAISIGKRNFDRMMEILFEVKEHAKEGLRETRMALRRLRKTEERKIYGTKELIKVLRTFEEVTGTKIDLELGNIRWTYGSTIDLTIYRLVQEALTNSIRHGQATRITIYFWQIREVLQISIRDNGKGAEKIEKGLGLMGMEERLQKLGGTLDISGANEGFHLTVTIPLSQNRSFEEKHGDGKNEAH